MTRVICGRPATSSLGIVMSPAAVWLARFCPTHDAAVIEDDYDPEFRATAGSLDALKTLDQTDIVFYVGTFSKVCFPRSARLCRCPQMGAARLVEAKRIADWHGTVLAQEALAIFIDEGHMARHVRKARTVYGRRRGELLRALANNAQQVAHGGDPACIWRRRC
jgi:GntR family transcriptional regulator/MocR family aminotransferase